MPFYLEMKGPRCVRSTVHSDSMLDEATREGALDIILKPEYVLHDERQVDDICHQVAKHNLSGEQLKRNILEE